MVETLIGTIIGHLLAEVGPDGYTVLDLRPQSTDLAPKSIFVFAEDIETPVQYADAATSCQFKTAVFVSTCFDPRAGNAGVVSVRTRVLKALTRAIPPVTALGALMVLDGDSVVDADGVTVYSAPVTLEWSETV